MRLRTVLGFNNIGTAALLQVSENTAQHVQRRADLATVREGKAPLHILDIDPYDPEPCTGLAKAIEAGFFEQLNKPGTFGP